MPRIRQNAERYADEDFRREVKCRQGYYDLMSMQALADATGIPRTTLTKRMSAPESMTVAEIRKIVASIHPDPSIILALFGYKVKEINRFKGNHEIV